MEKIILGSLCYTKYDKKVEYNDKEVIIQSGTIVLVCDDANIHKGYVLVEIEGYDTVFGYEVKELALIKN